VSRFGLISIVHSKRDAHIYNRFIRLLAVELARIQTDVRADVPVRIDAERSAVFERYAAMIRLLAEEDEIFLTQQGLPSTAKRLRREHRSCYFGYVTRLGREVRAARKLGALAMASKENWSFWTLLEQAVISESSLLYLRWLGCRHAAGVSVASRDVKECLDFLLGERRFRLAAT
jgi:hypothetical protein